MAEHADDTWTRAAATWWPDPPPPTADPLRIRADRSAPGALEVSGSVDLRSHAGWEWALRYVMNARLAVFSLDLAELDFIDVRGVGALVDVANQMDHDRQLVIDHPPLSLRRIMDVLWPHSAAVIRFEGDR